MIHAQATPRTIYQEHATHYHSLYHTKDELMQLKSVYLTLLLSLSLGSTHKLNSFDLTYKNIALASCATLAGITMSKLAYDYFFQLTDSQEYAQAINLCQQTEQLSDTIKATYSKSLDAYAWDDTTRSHALKMIAAQDVKNPFVTFVNNLQTSINNLIYYQDKLANTKIHIFERRIKLISQLTDASHEEILRLKSSIEGYDFALQEIDTILHDLTPLHAQLLKIQQAMSSHPFYIIEKQQLQIESLERELSFQSWTASIPAPPMILII